ncbi:60S ribosomal protein L32-1 [Tanacetum coccineum]
MHHQLEILTNWPWFLTVDKFSADSGKEYLELTYFARMKVQFTRECAIITDCAEIAHNVLTHKKKEIVERVTQLDIVVTNELARHELLQLTLRWKLRFWPTWSATDNVAKIGLGGLVIAD